MKSWESKRGDTIKTESTKYHKCKQAGNLMSDCPQRDPPKETNANNKEKPNRGIVKCYNCAQMGHAAIHCPNNVLFCDAGTRVSVRRQGVIEGAKVYCPTSFWIQGAHKSW